MSPGDAVRSASDKSQVEKAKRNERMREQRDREELADLLSLPAFRRYAWRLLTHCKVFESIWHQSAQIHYDSGRQDVGHFIMGEIAAIAPEAFVQMMVEAKKREEDTDA